MMSDTAPPPTADVLGVRIARLDRHAALDAIAGYIARGERRTVVFPNPFCVIESRRRSAYRDALNSADLALADGWPVVWASRWLGSAAPERVAGPDLFELVNARAARMGWTVYFVGGAIPSNAERVAAAVSCRFPGLRVVGTRSPPAGPVDGATARGILDDIARVRPDILWIGLGSPLQEAWIARHRHELAAHVTLAVGGTFNYYNGTRRSAPRWMREAALEWLHRIAQDPSLIWKKRFYAFAGEFFVPVWREALGRRIRRACGR